MKEDEVISALEEDLATLLTKLYYIRKTITEDGMTKTLMLKQSDLCMSIVETRAAINNLRDEPLES